ncbi:MAG: hypothetical protein M3M85_02455 [bacterium]|nr:hypothetical protein [bacterium]
MSEAVPKDFSLERKVRPIVKDSWLHEYIVANITAPQTFSAIAIFLSAAVLQDRPDTWDSFFSSSLSGTS